MGAIITSAKGLNSGASEVAGVGKTWRTRVTGTWANEESFVAALINALDGSSVQVGSGTVTGLQPTFAMTFKRKMNLLAQDGWYFSDFVRGPTVFNDGNSSGNGLVALADYFGTPENQLGLANFQSGVAIFARNTVQIWDVDPDRQNYNQRQVLKGVGTCAPASLQARGDTDVLFLHDSGPRSLRVRAATTNAYPFDVGSPVQKLVRAILAGLTDAQKAGACSIIDPETNNYWLYIPGGSGPGYIWVLADLPESGIVAWTKYVPSRAMPPDEVNYSAVGGGPIYEAFFSGLTVGRTYRFRRGATERRATSCLIEQDLTQLDAADGEFVATGSSALLTISAASPPGAVTASLQEVFEPEQFIVKDSRVYVRAGDEVFLYGGADNETYDRCGAQADTPFLNAKTPATRKSYSGVDLAADGTWAVSVGANPSNANVVALAYLNTDSSFERGRSPVALQGTHFKMRFEEMGDGAALLSSAILHFDGGDNK